MKKHATLLIIIPFFIACGNKKTQQNNDISCSSLTNFAVHPLNEYASDIRYVNYETNKKIPIIILSGFFLCSPAGNRTRIKSLGNFYSIH